MSSIRLFDVVIFIFSLILVTGSVFLVIGKKHGIRYVEVESSDDVFLLPLSENDTLTVYGPVGETMIRVENETVHVSDSDCRDKICMTMGNISHPSAWIACLPNKIFLRIVSQGQETEQEVDAGAY